MKTGAEPKKIAILGVLLLVGAVTLYFNMFSGDSSAPAPAVAPAAASALAAAIKVPEGTQRGKEFKLKGKGVPHLNAHGKGDLIVEIRVQTPSKLSKQQRELLKQLSETMVVENTPTSRGLFDKVKEMFS